MPRRPLSPPVSVVNRCATPQTTIPWASVIIRKYTPLARTSSSPKKRATTIVLMIASSAETPSGNS